MRTASINTPAKRAKGRGGGGGHGGGRGGSGRPAIDVSAASTAGASIYVSSSPSSGRSLASVTAAAATFAAEVRRMRSDSFASGAGDELVAEPVDDEGVLGFMRRARSDSSASSLGGSVHEQPAGIFHMDDHAPSSSSTPKFVRRGSVELEMSLPDVSDLSKMAADMQAPEPDEDELLERTMAIEIGRAQSPTQGDGEHIELESALLNQASSVARSNSSSNGCSTIAAAAAAAPASSSSATSYLPSPTERRAIGLSVGDFELLTVVGRGAYGKVFLVRKHATGRLYAMKVVAKSEAIRKNVVANMKAERDVLEAVRHPFIVNLRFAFQTDSKLYLVLDWIGGGELFARLDASKDHSLSVKEARFYAAEIVLALEHLHKLDIVYRDLKPENILLQRDGHLVLTDFGFAKENIVEAHTGTRSFCGTLHYMAPEMIEFSGHGKGSDWWALGALLFEMLTGSTPFAGNNRKTIQANILSAPLKLPKWMDNPTKSILDGLLTRPVAKRLGCGLDGAAAIKRHGFFAGVDWVGLAAKKVTPPFVPPMADAADTANFDARFTAERAVDTPVSPSQMATVLAGHGISPGAFHTADATFANFAYRRDHTPAASPALRGMVHASMSMSMSLMMARQNSTGSNSSTGSAGAGAAGPMSSPRLLSGLPPPHHPAPGSLELSPLGGGGGGGGAWPSSDPAAVKQREEQAAAKATQRKAAQAAVAAASAANAAAAAASLAALSPSVSAAAPSVASPTAALTPASPQRVKKPKAMKASPHSNGHQHASANGHATAAASAAPPAAAVPAAAHQTPRGGASSQLSQQLAARQQHNKQHQQQQSDSDSSSRPASAVSAVAATSAAPAATSAVPPHTPVSRGWEVKAAAPTPAPAAASLGIRVLGGIQPAAVVAAPSAASAAAPPSSAASAASSSSSSVAAPPAKKLSAPLRLSASAAVFVPGASFSFAKPAATFPNAAPASAASSSAVIPAPQSRLVPVPQWGKKA